MTGITKDELVQMARGAGISVAHSEHTIICDASELMVLINAILERAAAECDLYKLPKDSQISAYHRGISDMVPTLCAAIRALKINTGD